METVKTDAIPLRSIKHSESSRIITFFTEEAGIVSIMGKGVRKARHFVPFDTFSRMNIVFRSKSTREVQLLLNGELLDSFLSIRSHFEKTAVAFSICELLLRTLVSDDPNPPLFRFTIETLKSLNSAQAGNINFLWFFQLGLAKALGMGLDLEGCVICGKNSAGFSGDKYHFSYENGGIICPECRRSDKIHYSLRPEALKILQFLSTKELEKAGILKASPSAAREIDSVLNSYLKFHIEGLQSLRSRELLLLK